MPAIALDTSVVVAAVARWHSEHARCVRAVDSALARPPVVLPRQVLHEAYSVLTRMPPPHRLSPATALDVLEQTLRGGAEVVGLDGSSTWTFLGKLRDAGVAGGTIYDAVIVESAVAGGAESILTLNLRHFQRLAPPGLAVLEP